MIAAKIRSQMQEIMVAEMLQKNWVYVKSSNLFRNITNDWIRTCSLDFVNRGSHLALETQYLLSNKHVSLDWKKFSHYYACTPFLFGGDSSSVAEYLGVPYLHEFSEQLYYENDDIDVFCNDWFADIERIGLPFWEKFCSYEKINDVMNAPPYDKLPPLVLSQSNRILRGPILAYYAKTSYSEIVKLLNEYNKILVESKMEKERLNKYNEAFQAVKAFVLDRMVKQGNPTYNP